MAAAPESSPVTSVLSYIDTHQPIRNCSTLVSFVIDLEQCQAVKAAAVLAAAEGVARKWRLFAGRAKFSERLARWTVEQPTTELSKDYQLVKLTSTAHDAPSPVKLIKITPTTCGDMAQFAESEFISADTLHPIAELADKDAPLVAIQITTYADLQCIGITVNHAVLDAHGFGQYIRCFNAELNGIEWTAPELETANQLDSAIARVARDSAGHPEVEPASALTPSGMGHGSTLLTWWRLKQLEWADWIEESWFGTERAAVFMGNSIADNLISAVKEQVKRETEGREFVSSGDILTAWILKAAYSNEWWHTQLKTTSILDLRQLLKFTSPHPSTWMYLAPDWPSPTRASLAALALHNRRRLDTVRTPQKAAAFILWLQSFAEKPTKPLHATVGLNCWIFTNQSASGIATAVDWGAGPGVGYQCQVGLAPGEWSDSFAINQLKDGFTWAGKMRKSRWAAVRRELARLEADLCAGQAAKAR